MVRRKPRPLAERFLEQVEKGPSCWRWTGALNMNGYGHIRLEPQGQEIRGRRVGAHRAAWLIFHGALPSGMEVMHTCDHPACVNPGHLRLGTHAENMADMLAKGRDGHGVLSGESNPRARLTSAEVARIRAIYAAGGVRQKDVAAQFGITQAMVSRIVRGASWGHGSSSAAA